MSPESTPSKLAPKRKQPEENSEPSLTAEPKQKKPRKSKDKSKNDVAKSEGETETVKEETKEDKKARKAAKKAVSTVCYNRHWRSLMNGYHVFAAKGGRCKLRNCPTGTCSFNQHTGDTGSF